MVAGPLAADAGAERAAAADLALAGQAAISVEPACVAVGTVEVEYAGRADGPLIINIARRKAAPADAVKAAVGLHAPASAFAVGRNHARQGGARHDAEEESEQDFHGAAFVGDRQIGSAPPIVWRPCRYSYPKRRGCHVPPPLRI